MGINGIMPTYPVGYEAVKTKQTAFENNLTNKVMKCVRVGGKKTELCSDALMSYASPLTGESVNIYKADNYSKSNPVYVIKGLDSDGNRFEQKINAQEINPNNCSYNEFMILNIETGHTKPSDYLRAAVTRDKAGVSSFFDKRDFIAYAQFAMNDQKRLGNWTGYLMYDKWINDISKFSKVKNNTYKNSFGIYRPFISRLKQI